MASANIKHGQRSTADNPRQMRTLMPYEPIPPDEPYRVEEMIESFIHAFANSVNDRILPPPATAIAIDRQFQAIAFPPFKFNFDEYCNHLAEVMKEFPSYRTTILEVDTSVDVESGHAHTFMNFEMTGVPDGLIRKSVAVVRFRRRNQGWTCFEYQAADGCEGG